MGKRMLNAEINLENHSMVLDKIFMMIMDQTLEEKKEPPNLGKIQCNIMRHLCKVCASAIPMMKEEARPGYREALIRCFTEGLDDEFKTVEKFAGIMQGEGGKSVTDIIKRALDAGAEIRIIKL